MRDIIADYQAATANDFATEIVIDRGEGVYLIDNEGKRYLDFAGGFGVVNVGYGHPEMLDAIARQSRKICFSPPWHPSAESADLARLLQSVTGLKDYKCIRATGGGDAIEAAFRVARANRPGKILSFYYSYHGGTYLTSITGDHSKYYFSEEHPLPQSKVPPAYEFRKSDPDRTAEEITLAEIEKKFKEATYSCLIVEPVIGSGGIIPFSPSCLRGIERLCRAYDVLLILDEVITGFGRTGAGQEEGSAKHFYFQQCGVRPDMITLAKGMSSGYVPIGTCMVSPDLLEKYHDTYHDITSTYSWMPLAAKVAETNIRLILANELARRVQENAAYLKEGLSRPKTRGFSSRPVGTRTS